MNIKLVATDIGGTLARDDGSLSENTVGVLGAVINNGIKVALVTGYNMEMTQKFSSKIPGDIITIIQNGAIIYEGDELIQTNYLKKETARKVIIFFESKGFTPILFSGVEGDGKVYYKRSNEKFAPRSSFIEVNDFKEVLSEDPVEISAWESTEDILAVKEEAENLFGDEWYVTASIQEKRSWLEVLNPKARKVEALLTIMRKKGIKPEEVIYFGDNYNDVECLKAVKFAVVVENGLPDVKKFAWRVAPSNNEDGVASLLKNILNL